MNKSHSTCVTKNNTNHYHGAQSYEDWCNEGTKMRRNKSTATESRQIPIKPHHDHHSGKTTKTDKIDVKKSLTLLTKKIARKSVISIPTRTTNIQLSKSTMIINPQSSKKQQNNMECDRTDSDTNSTSSSLAGFQEVFNDDNNNNNTIDTMVDSPTKEGDTIFTNPPQQKQQRNIVHVKSTVATATKGSTPSSPTKRKFPFEHHSFLPKKKIKNSKPVVFSAGASTAGVGNSNKQFSHHHQFKKYFTVKDTPPQCMALVEGLCPIMLSKEHLIAPNSKVDTITGGINPNNNNTHSYYHSQRYNYLSEVVEYNRYDKLPRKGYATELPSAQAVAPGQWMIQILCHRNTNTNNTKTGDTHGNKKYNTTFLREHQTDWNGHRIRLVHNDHEQYVPLLSSSSSSSSSSGSDNNNNHCCTSTSIGRYGNVLSTTRINPNHYRKAVMESLSTSATDRNKKSNENLNQFFVGAMGLVLFDGFSSVEECTNLHGLLAEGALKELRNLLSKKDYANSIRPPPIIPPFTSINSKSAPTEEIAGNGGIAIPINIGCYSTNNNFCTQTKNQYYLLMYTDEKINQVVAIDIVFEKMSAIVHRTKGSPLLFENDHAALTKQNLETHSSNESSFDLVQNLLKYQEHPPDGTPSGALHGMSSAKENVVDTASLSEIVDDVIMSNSTTVVHDATMEPMDLENDPVFTYTASSSVDDVIMSSSAKDVHVSTIGTVIKPSQSDTTVDLMDTENTPVVTQSDDTPSIAHHVKCSLEDVIMSNNTMDHHVSKIGTVSKLSQSYVTINHASLSMYQVEEDKNNRLRKISDVVPLKGSKTEDHCTPRDTDSFPDQVLICPAVIQMNCDHATLQQSGLESSVILNCCQTVGEIILDENKFIDSFDTVEISKEKDCDSALSWQDVLFFELQNANFAPEMSNIEVKEWYENHKLDTEFVGTTDSTAYLHDAIFGGFVDSDSDSTTFMQFLWQNWLFPMLSIMLFVYLLYNVGTKNLYLNSALFVSKSKCIDIDPIQCLLSQMEFVGTGLGYVGTVKIE